MSSGMPKTLRKKRDKSSSRRKKSYRFPSSWPSSESQENRSKAIYRAQKIPECCLIDTNKANGRRQFRYTQDVNRNDAQSEDIPPYFKSLIEKSFQFSSELFPWHEIAEEWPQHRTSDSELQDDSITSDVIIRILASNTASNEEKQNAVIESEVVAFPPDSVDALNRLLFQFIKQYRDSDNQQYIVAVGSAIRKYVAVMDRVDISALTVLLDANHNATVPPEVELEIAKTIVRKLIQSPPDSPDIEPLLADRLYEIASSYLNPRLLPRDKYAAIALNAILSLCLLRSPYAEKVHQSLEYLSVSCSWFTELVSRRAYQIQHTLFEKFPEKAASYTEKLAALSQDTTLSER